TALTMRTSEVEVRFYQQAATALAARIPRCHFADVDVDTARFVLLLEDLSPARQGDQMAGCTVDEAAAALDELAMVHAPRWGDPGLRTLDWLDRRNETGLAFLEALYPGMFAGFAERYGDDLAEPVGRIGEAFFPHVGTYLRLEAPVRTIQHADFRVDNLLYGADDGTRIAVVDWQTVALGPGAADVAYFLGGSVEVDDRRANEKDLLRHYLDHLQALGADGYEFDELWEDYRRYAFAGLVMAVGAAMTVARTDRGDDMFLAMARRAAAHAEDLDALGLLVGA
ncbi:MAG TPA: oxidoreductase family protein, partial [Acidimicrobiales bacterium]|nr:oxidoreductase family protein [Acidimicrobiales bacterium]